MNEETIIGIERRTSSLIGKAIASIYKDKEALYLEFASGEDDFEYLIVMGFLRLIFKDKIILSTHNLRTISQFDEPIEIIKGSPVQEIRVGDYGDVTFLFANGAKLELISHTSYDETMWNLAESDDKDTIYFVVTPYACGRAKPT
jgi:hypothetical protein